MQSGIIGTNLRYSNAAHPERRIHRRLFRLNLSPARSKRQRQVPRQLELSTDMNINANPIADAEDRYTGDPCIR